MNSRRTKRGCASRKAGHWTIPAASGATPTSSTCDRRERWPSCFRIFPRRSRTASRSRGAATWNSRSGRTTFRTSRCRRAPRRRSACADRPKPDSRVASRNGAEQPAEPAPYRAPPRLGARCHHPHGLRRLLSHRRRLSPAGLARTGCRSDPAEARGRGPWWGTHWGSPTSIR